MVNIPVSSETKRALAEGRVIDANILLGSTYYLKGIVVEGFRIGKTIGFPTANIKLDDDSPLLLPFGVYAVTVDLNGRRFKGMANIGIRPTMENHQLTIEVNIFDFNEDIYGQPLIVYFIDRLREEKKFSGLEEMKKNIELDRIRAMEILSLRDDTDTNSK
jgi:riboflavin kinase/FMN adenylyltransferase